VCGTCHALNAELFAGSPHKEAFDQIGLPECETCHSNHEIKPVTKSMLGVHDNAICSSCHSAVDNPKGYAAALAMRAMVDSLDTADSAATALVEEAEQKGMEIGEAKFRLRDVRQARMETRTVVHAFSQARVRTVVDKGMGIAVKTEDEARDAIQEYYFRRTGLGVASLIITVLAFGLYVLIRRIERQQQRPA
jgi:predicted CXXCH cytochrome family protein